MVGAGAVVPQNADVGTILVNLPLQAGKSRGQCKMTVTWALRLNHWLATARQAVRDAHQVIASHHCMAVQQTKRLAAQDSCAVHSSTYEHAHLCEAVHMP
jgi:hypothetical protein